MLQATPRLTAAASATCFFLFSLVPSNRTRGGWQPQDWVGPSLTPLFSARGGSLEVAVAQANQHLSLSSRTDSLPTGQSSL